MKVYSMKTKLYVFALATSGILTICNLNLCVGDKENGYKLMRTEVEALADPEWNHWTQWIDQGFTKDEREERIPCQGSKNTTVSGSVSKGGTTVSGSVSVTQPSGTYKITCPTGENNCTTVEC